MSVIKFNDIDVKIYDLDTIDTIISRLAAKENILPKFIYFPNGRPTFNTVQVKFENLLPLFTNEQTFGGLYEKLKNTELSPYEIVYYYIIINPKFGIDEVFLIQLIEEVKKILPESNIQFQEIYKSRDSSVIDFYNSIEKFKTDTDKQLSTFIDFNNVVGSEYSEFEIEKIKFKLNFKLSNISLLDIFNNIKLDNTYIFATTHSFYKILRDIIPFTEWTNLFDKNISGQITEKVRYDRRKNIIFKAVITDEIPTINDFTETILSLEEEGIYSAIFEYDFNTYDITKENLIKSFRGITNIDVPVLSETIESVSGIFYIPNFQINTYVLADLILTDPLFSSLLGVNEREITAKTSIYLYFNSDEIGNITSSISNRVVTNKPPVKDMDISLWPRDSTYVRVKITKADNIEKVKKFQVIFMKLLELYTKKYDDIVNIYMDLGVDISIEPIEPVLYIEKQVLRDIEPNVFKPGYTRKCPHQVTNISDNEVNKYTSKGLQVLTFPKIVTNGIIPKKYVCLDPKFRYPGLRDNPFDNVKDLPYIPCCYNQDQSSIPGSRYRNYYFDEAMKIRTTRTEYTSGIILPNNGIGLLPQNIDTLFTLSKSLGEFRRKGMYKTKHSFLQCILEALGNNVDESSLIKTRLSLATPELASSCKQELYDKSIKEIQEKILNLDEYFDPKLFIHLLEVNYNCTIFIFSKEQDDEEANVSMVIPRHTKGYFKLKNKNNIICIYEHYGSESGGAEYPQCELIIEETKPDIIPLFSGGNISSLLFGMFKKINTSYIKSDKILPIEFTLLNNNTSLISQSIDVFGKCRLINVMHKTHRITLFTTPLPPFNIKVTSNDDITYIDSNILSIFINDTGCVVKNQVKGLNGVISGVIVTINNNELFIPTSTEYIPYKVDIVDYRKTGFIIPSNDTSVMKQYEKSKRLARYIIQYSYWLFSKFIENRRITDASVMKLDKTMEDFKDMYIEFDPEFIYGDTSQYLSMTSGVMRNNHIILKNIETWKRIKYSIRLFIDRSYNQILDYYKKVIISDYYIDISDFTDYTKQVLLQGNDAIRLWLKEKSYTVPIVYDIITTKNTIYFFRNSLIDNTVYLAQNVSTIQHAVNILYNWYINDFNEGINISDVINDVYESKLYSITNNRTIQLYVVSGKKSNMNFQILGTKINGNPIYTPLISL